MAARVLFIAGSGRSGTTFLSLILSQHPDTHNIGQIRDLHQAIDKSDVCTCGHLVVDCPYWKGVRADMEAAFGDRAIQILNEDAVAFRRDAKARKAWNSPALRAEMAATHADFLNRIKGLYLSASANAQGRMLIDSSKSVDLVYALSLIPEIDLHVLNLVRDPRAVAVWWSKLLKRQEKRRARAETWTYRQQACDYLRQHSPATFKLLRYEDLTAHARNSVQAIQDWAGLSADLSSFTSDNTTAISWDRAHLFRPSNETVLKEHLSEFVVKAADSWKDPANAEVHALAEEYAFPFAAQLGYTKGQFN